MSYLVFASDSEFSLVKGVPLPSLTVARPDLVIGLAASDVFARSKILWA